MNGNYIELKGRTVKERFLEYASVCLKGEFIVDENIDLILKTFEENKRGILLCGNPGCGKTMIFQILQRITHPQDERHFKIKSTMSAVIDFNNEGHEIFTRDFFSKNVLWDDLGLENKGKHYGNNVEVMEQILFIAYERYKTAGHLPSFTTMQLPKELEARYGAWFYSRLQEMCERITIKHDKDYRQLRNFKSFPPVKHLKIKTEEDLAIERYYENCKNLPFPNNKPATLGQILKEQFGTPKK